MNPDYEHLNPYEGCDLYRGDALEVLPWLAGQGVRADMVLADPPYGTTHCRWDAVIDIPGIWKALKGITLPRTPVLLFCQQPFTSVLGASNLKRAALRVGMGEDAADGIPERPAHADEGARGHPGFL